MPYFTNSGIRAIASDPVAFAAIPRGIIWPAPTWTVNLGNSMTMDAATEKCAAIGRVYFNGRPSGAKTMSTGTIQFRVGTTTFSEATIDVGIQGVATGAGPIAQPDGSYVTKKTVTAGGWSSNTWITVTMDTGSTNITHGDLIAVVWDMTARVSDSVIVQSGTTSGEFAQATNAGPAQPITNVFLAGAWGASAASGGGRVPNVYITTDDGTIGWFDFTMPVSNANALESWSNSTNPDERGMIFQVPFDCKIDALWAACGGQSANGDFTFKLYSDPTGTPTLLTSQTMLIEQMAPGNAQAMAMVIVPEQTLTRNTDYCVSVRATGTTNTQLYAVAVPDTSFRVVNSAGTTFKKATRDNDTGAFSAESPATTMYIMGVRISAIPERVG